MEQISHEGRGDGMSDPVTIGFSIAAIVVSVAAMALTVAAMRRQGRNLAEERTRRRSA